MRRIRIFSSCLDLVAEEMEVNQQTILSDNKGEDVVDARHLLVMLMYEMGLYPVTIAQLVGCTSRNVNTIISGFRLRCDRRKLLRNSYERLKKHIGNISFTDLN